MRKISQAGINLIKSFEGLRLRAYKPVPTEEYWTIGYGHYGSDVTQNMTITKEEAEQLLVSDLDIYENYVNDLYYCPVTKDLNQNQFDALVSFTYNCGSGNLRNLCRGKTITEIAENLPLYNKSSGTILAGLVQRRNAELELFNKEMLEMDEKEADFILTVLGNYWEQMEGNKDIQEYTHYIANQFRKALGRDEK